MKEFKPSSWSIDNKTSIYVLAVFLSIAGFMAYQSAPKEQFPEIVFPQMYVITIHPGTAPADMENTITKPLEKELKAVVGVKNIKSTSYQDYSSITVEFNTNVDIPVAKQRVKDAIDKADNELPQDLEKDPQVIEVDVSQVPIMNVNVSGNYDLDKLKKFSEDLEDRIESMKEITRVDLVGALDREIQINVDKYKMEAADVTLGDVERAVAYENMTISGGLLSVNGQKRNISIKGEFDTPLQLENIIIRSGSGAQIYLKDIATIEDSHKEKESFARLEGQNVITLNVIKRSGENLINAADKIEAIIDEMKEKNFPSDLKITITGDQSATTRVTLHDLNNTIIIGFILVTIILMFFMGTTNAMFVGLSVPISMFITFSMGLPVWGLLADKNITMNMIVLFSILLALGIVVDDAIVVIENTHRIFENGKKPIKQAAKEAAGEVFLPVLSGTLTTLAPFFPLMFMPGVTGKFIWFLPVTLIVMLFSSLISAYIFNPVFAVDTMKPHDHHESKKITKSFKITSLVFLALAAIFYIAGNHGMGNFTITIYALVLLNKFILGGMITSFQDKWWPKVQNGYAKLLTWSLTRYRPIFLLIATVALFFFSLMLAGKLRSSFFPQAEPNFIFAYIEMPIGTDQVITDSITKIVENRMMGVLGTKNSMVESVISNVGKNAGDPNVLDMSTTPHKGKVTVAFVEFSKRNGKSTAEYLSAFRKVVKGIPGATIIVDQEKGGPPTGKPVNIEVAGDDYDELIKTSEQLIRYLNEKGVGGIEELKSDVLKNNPEIVVEIDREKANREGVSTAQIALEIRTALFGKEISKYREDNDEYDIYLRFKEDQRKDIESLLNSKITYRDMNMGGVIRQIPFSSFAKVHYSNTYGGINRKNQKRVITVASNILAGFSNNQVVADIQKALPDFPAPESVSIKMTGEQEDQAETSNFIGTAMLISIGIILLILVLQFNSISKPLIILTEIFFSMIGVFLGFYIFDMEVSIFMTGIGIVALAGIVVRNGILMVEFTEVLEKQGMPTLEAIIHAGRTRMTPVLMTASATILGLVPLAVGLNIDFVTLFTDLNPHLFFGGDSVAFWGPLSWTMIFGLGFATFLTLILVPVMYLLVYKIKLRVYKNRKPVVAEHQASNIPLEIY